MTFEEVTREAALTAERAAALTMTDMRHRHVFDEDDVSGHLIGCLRSGFHHAQIAGINWSASVLRHRRGMAAEERRWGADILIHVSMTTPQQTYSKGVLVPAKKADANYYWSQTSHDRLVAQCNTMLSTTPAAFVFNYTNNGIRCGAATRVAGAAIGTGLNYLCGWTSYRFFLQLFRCPIGDPRITSAQADALPVPFVVNVDLQGELTFKEGASL